MKIITKQTLITMKIGSTIKLNYTIPEVGTIQKVKRTHRNAWDITFVYGGKVYTWNISENIFMNVSEPDKASLDLCRAQGNNIELLDEMRDVLFSQLDIYADEYRIVIESDHDLQEAVDDYYGFD